MTRAPAILIAITVTALVAALIAIVLLADTAHAATCRAHSASTTSHPILRGERRWYVTVSARWTSTPTRFCSWSFSTSTGRTVHGPDWQYHGHVLRDTRWRGDGWRMLRTEREWQQPAWPLDCFPVVILRIYRGGGVRAYRYPECYS